MSHSIKKTTTYTQVMYQKADTKAKNLGLTFHEYIKHLIANSIAKDKKLVEYTDDKLAKEILDAKKEHKNGKYDAIRHDHSEDFNKLFS